MDEIQALEQEILEKKRRLSELRRAQAPRPVNDHTFRTETGSVRLSELFGEHQDLVLIHNMGMGCRYCTLWADGFNGAVPELESRAGFVLVSADPPEKHYPFKRSRGWRFNSVTDGGGAFRRALGFCDAQGDPWPIAAGFRKEADGRLFLIARADLGERDDFCSTWHLFDLLRDGWNGWEPANRL